ncbi:MULTISPECIES: virulence factor Mce family protein [Mycobacterium]|uniref:virulence factor Mce family protein n=1 Tax=Mycobacterium TaxID=1763 RepID=UPI001EEFB6E3|nr:MULTISPECIES: virulence factor Mce family protein [Mycobacterium]BDB39975.1 Mce family protein Mce1D [Mycobacterium kiyosense]BDE11825.1 Mce family protein Mce1D [Mycobacterium sp. 20KCMC460]GLB90002.1 Mce family protein Mce1D [Mycobacterium kiyosense]GLC02453.1 Mce family protein Mce1D [Mycobacterium kiyosense]GLC05783.1 Mce family protein Mce1D [Mycobacterium kiyosense]
MSTIFDIRNIRLPVMSRATIIVGVLVGVLAIVAGLVGWNLYQKLTNNYVVAYFSAANALYPGDKVQIMGLKVGRIDSIEPAGDKMKVTFHYENQYKVPANASAIILNPTLVASRAIQLEPAYKGGPVLANNAVIPLDRTQVPVEWDELRNSITNIISKLGPTEAQPTGPFGEVINSFANGLAGKGRQLNSTLDNLSKALTALNEGRGDFFAVVKSLALFVNALHQDDQQFVALNQNLAQFTGRLASSDHALANAIEQLDGLLTTIRPFLDKNREVLTHDVNNLADVTNTLLQPDTLNGLETALHILPTAAANVNQIYHPAHGSVVSVPEITSFANPMQFICSSVQAGSRLGYQESAELCAEYMAPVLDAIKFNYFPFGFNGFSTAEVLPKMVAYSEPRLQPPNGYKDTTVPGIWVPDTPTSHRNTQQGWIVAPGMQGTQVGPITAGLLTPESLSELMGGPDIPPVQSTLQTPPGPPNAYDENPILPPIGLNAPQVPIPPPPPGPEVRPGPVAPTPGPAAPVGAPLPAEAGGGQ